MKLGMTMYSFNDYAREEKMDVLGFIRTAADLGVEAVDLLAYYWKDEREEPLRARELIEDLGLELAAYAVGNNFVQESEARLQEQVDYVRRGIEMAYELGAPVLRIFGGHAPHMPKEEALKLAAEGIERVLEEAQEADVVLALENHGGVPGTAEELTWLIEHFDSPWLRACVDVGNFVHFEDPAEAVARVVGYAAHVHIKDLKKVGEGEQAKWEACTPGEGDIDYDRILPLFKDAGYDGALSIEAEGPEDDMVQARKAVEWLRGKLEALAD